jgi:flagellar hook-basal body complex protein FliE
MSDPLPHLNVIRPTEEVLPVRPVTSADDVKGASFSQYMKEQISRVNEQQKDATTAIEMLATGETQNVGEVMNQVKKAEIAFNMLLEVRNKVQDAYSEIMRMQI